VAEGPPEAVAANAGSYTGQFLAEVLGALPLERERIPLDA